MSIDNPRRIFRTSRKPVMRTVLALCGVGAVVFGVAVLAELAERPAAAPVAGLAAPLAVISAAPDRVAVIDGDTLRLGGQVVRLSDIEAPARGEACAAGSDCGGRATAMLASLVGGRAVQCRVSGYDRLGRPSGRCDAGGTEVNVALVETGWARAEAADLDAAEADARTHRRGIWLTH